MYLFKHVGDFHQKFGLPYFGEPKEFDKPDREPPHFLEADVQDFREKFLDEELLEFKMACQEGDLAKAADALADLVYVALGTAHLMHVPFDRVWFEVHRANMAKERATGADDPRSTRPHVLNVVKPANWTPPDIEGALREYDR